MQLTSTFHKPTTLSDTDPSDDTKSEDGTDLRRDSRWKYPPTSQPTAKAAAVETPTSCFGHFDRLDIEYTPKPKTSARVVVYHDGPVAAWSNTDALRGAGISSRDFAEQCALGETESSVEDGSTGRPSLRRPGSASSSMQDADAATDEEKSPTEQRAEATRALLEEAFITDDEEGEYPAPWNILTSLRVLDDAERQPQAEDLYFAARLAATCVILLRDELEDAARVLGQWSINLVGRRHWYRMVENYITTPRDDNDNGA